MGNLLEQGKNFIFGRPSGGTSEPSVDPALLSQEGVNEAIARIMSLTSGPGSTFGPVGPATAPGTVGPAVSPGQLPVGIEQSPFFAQFRSALTDRFTPTAPENQLLSDIMDQTSAQFARRGLGASPVAGSATAASIAPTLVALRQQQIGNLSGALSQSLAGQQLGLTQRGQDIGTILANLQAGIAQRGQNIDLSQANLNAGVTQRGQDIQSSLTQRNASLQALLELLGFGKRTPLGQLSTQRGAQGPQGGMFTPIGLSASPGGGGGGSPSGA